MIILNKTVFLSNVKWFLPKIKEDNNFVAYKNEIYIKKSIDKKIILSIDTIQWKTKKLY